MLYRSNSISETEKIAAGLAKKITLRFIPGKAMAIALEGELGAGKTTFVKSFACALGVKQKLTSPTFVLMRHYPLATTHYSMLYHLDAYRLKDEKDLLPLGITEILADSKNIVLIEWAERVQKILPKKHITVHFDHIDEHTRQILIK